MRIARTLAVAAADRCEVVMTNSGDFSLDIAPEGESFSSDPVVSSGSALGVARALSGDAPKFTEQQLRHWWSYENVRKSGKFNMFDPRARKATRLDGDEYSFVMNNYSALKDAAEAA